LFLKIHYITVRLRQTVVCWKCCKSTDGDAGTADPPTIVLHVDCSRITHSITIYFTGSQNFQNLRSYLQIPGARRL